MWGGSLDTGCWSVAKGVNKWMLCPNESCLDYTCINMLKVQAIWSILFFLTKCFATYESPWQLRGPINKKFKIGIHSVTVLCRQNLVWQDLWQISWSGGCMHCWCFRISLYFKMFFPSNFWLDRLEVYILGCTKT